MTIKISIQRPLFQSSRGTPISRLTPPTADPDRFIDTLIHHAGDQRVDALKHQKVRRVPPPKQPAPTPEGPSILNRAFSWLKGKYAVASIKQLRVAETVSLGEKRFIAIIHADGHKFLIGGGASGVSLLTQLGELPQSTHAFPSIEKIAELSA